jgi:hypothetical protein
MGEIADMMIDGTMCPCGQFVDDGADGPGFMQFCSPQCEEDYGGGVPNVTCTRAEKTVMCKEHPRCERRFRTQQAMDQHWRDVHA